jgi:hypothetical protein
MWMKTRLRTTERKRILIPGEKIPGTLKCCLFSVGCSTLRSDVQHDRNLSAKMRKVQRTCVFKSRTWTRTNCCLCVMCAGCSQPRSAPRSRLQSKARSRDGWICGPWTTYHLDLDVQYFKTFQGKMGDPSCYTSLKYRSGPRPWAVKALPTVIKPCTYASPTSLKVSSSPSSSSIVLARSIAGGPQSPLPVPEVISISRKTKRGRPPMNTQILSPFLTSAGPMPTRP